MNPERDPSIVETAYGALKGEVLDGVLVWRGIPFAAPLTAETRFQKPEPPKSWEGVRDALEFGPMCPQSRDLKHRSSVTTMSEDCLTLNIWAPATAARPSADSGKCPVLFYIHGGSFAEGAGSDREYIGTNLVREGDVVVVTLNYRLSLFGFMDFSFLDKSFSANCGLHDIMAALRWVKQNIEAFGGDPDNITACGQSAGATCACILSAMKEARGYLKRIIMMSGVPSLLQTPEQAKQIAECFLEFARISNPGSLREANDIGLGLKQKEFSLYIGLSAATYAPVVDGDLVERFPISSAIEGHSKGVPVLIGTTREEMSIMFNKLLSHIIDIRILKEKGLQAEIDDVKQRITRSYERYGKRGRMIMVSDYVFRMPSVWFAEAHSKHTNTWMYRFDYETLGMRVSKLHAFHSSDIPFLFGNFKDGHARFMLALSPVKTGIHEVHRELRSDFLQFMKTGSLPWERCDGENTPAKCYALPPAIEQAIHPDVKKSYDGSEFKRRCLAGESNNLAIDPAGRP